MNSQSNELSIYIHWPFCKTKCPYCDFNSHESDYIEHDSWKKSYLTEIELNKDLIQNKKIKSIFFGGGTNFVAQIRKREKIDYKTKKN